MSRSGALYAPAADHLDGTGSPEGVVAAPVGTRYTDRNATAGAVEWTKTSGTGTTGWTVTAGDTGWRNISDLLVNGWTGTVVARRVVGTVEIRVGDLADNSSSTPDFVSALPSGFRLLAATPATVNATAALITGTAAVDSGVMNAAGGSGEKLRGTLPQTDGNGSLVAMTPDPWPTSLPGTAA